MAGLNGERVFCVGMNKTGTSSLGHCFSILKLLPLASPSHLKAEGTRVSKALLERGDCEPALALADRYRSFEDRPWNLPGMYEELDRRYPGSRFILTERSPETWWRSVEQWLTVTKPGMVEMYRLHLGLTSWGKEQAVEAFLDYNRAVRAYFEGSERLLVMNLEDGDGWEVLCNFLGRAVPPSSFPHANRQAYHQADRENLLAARRRKNRRSCRQCGSIMPKYGDGPRPVSAEAKVVDWGINTFHRAQGACQLQTVGRSARAAAKVRARAAGEAPEGFAVVTSYFNPCGYASRSRNFQFFNEGMRRAGVPVLTVELAIGDQPFDLDVRWGEQLRLRCSDVMWHKEKLLNLGIRSLLKQGYDKIAWLDCDILFDDGPAWSWNVAAQLDRTPICQVFTHLWQRAPSRAREHPAVGAVWYAGKTGARTKQPRVRPLHRRGRGTPLGLSGLGWAATADVLREVPLYEHAILGGADRMMYLASFAQGGDWEHDMRTLLCSFRGCSTCGYRNQSEAYTDHALDWARRWSAVVDGRLGAAPQRIQHCHHGDRARRGYMRRREILFENAYDPRTDVVSAANGCWRWASDKHWLHRDVAAYFTQRSEDA